MSSTQPKLPKPRIFIGSSIEGLPIAEAIQLELLHKADAFLWSSLGSFPTGTVTIDALLQAANYYEFGIFVMSPDVKTVGRDTEEPTPRDNVIFEFGLFAGCKDKNHVFIVKPLNEKVELPSDLDGITPARYTKVTTSGTARYHVTAAVTEIMSRINDVRASTAGQWAGNFWESLSDSVAIVYGVEYAGTNHPRISLRDLDTATDILRFLTRWYPKKHTLFIRAETPGWENSLLADTDIILVGGPVTNSEYAKRSSDCERSYHLRLGRLCEVQSQSVYHVVLGEGSGKPIPPRTDPQAINDFPSDYVQRDYGLVTSRHISIKNFLRRIITVAGIKGNGTRAAASALLGDSRNPIKLDSILQPLTDADSLEMVVAADVVSGTIERTEVVELTLNGKRQHVASEKCWEPCELQQPCECRELYTEGRRANS
jgi:hypothetical protein